MAWVILLFSLVASMARAATSEADCTDRDQSEKLGSLRHQGAKGWCYGFVAADLIGYKMKLKPPEQVSAFDVSMQYYYNRNPYRQRGELSAKDNQYVRELIIDEQAARFWRKRDGRQLVKPASLEEGGMIDGAIATYNLVPGACLERQLPSQSVKSESSYLFQNLNKLNEIGVGDLLPLTEETVAKDLALTGTLGLLPRKCQPKSQMHPAMVNMINELANQKVLEKVNRACRGRLGQPSYVPHSLFIGKGVDVLLQQLNQQLSQNNIVGYSYNSCFMNSQTEKIGWAASAQIPVYVKTPGGCHHASSLVGRRWNRKLNACEYKLRDSYGTDCKGYSKEYRERCRKEHGYLWLSEEEVANNGVTWM